MEKINVLVTGANGFIGKNLISQLNNIKHGKAKADFSVGEIFCCDIETSQKELCDYAKNCDFVFHLAGVNRPQTKEEFMTGNFGFTTTLLECLKKSSNKAKILMSSSIQASLDNDYGKSKKAGEDYLLQYGKLNNVSTYIFRLPNVFGKWCRPNYNSVVATFCNNIVSDLPIMISDRNNKLTLVYIDDVIDAFLNCLIGKVSLVDRYCKVDCEYDTTLGYLADKLYSFKESRNNLITPIMPDNSLDKKLYSTYLSYFGLDDFAYDIKMNIDNRGSFTEFMKFDGYGQVSVNIIRPSIVKGNHWHHTKNEKFLVVSGNGVIRFRKIGETAVKEYFVSGAKLQVVDIPCGYTHNIQNVGDSDMVTIMWANEAFDANKPDTFFEEV